MSNTRPLLVDSQPVEAEHVSESPALTALKNEVEALHEELDQLRQDCERDRNQLSSILQGLRTVFGGGQVESVPAASATSQPKWEAQKRLFPGRPADLIDLLLTRPNMNTTEIATALRSDPRTITKVIFILNKAGLIDKNGGRFSLKQI
jgi:CheY-like chemotaxis protein